MHAADASAEPSADGRIIAPRFQVHAYGRVPRILGAVLQVLLVADLLSLSLLIVFDTFTGALNPTPPAQAGWLALLALVLFGLLQILRWFSAATFLVEPERLVLERRGDRFEIPLSSVVSIQPWRLPLPGAGLSLRMKSGRTFQYSPQVSDPLPLLEALGRHNPELSATARPSLTAFAHARAMIVRQRWYHLAFKFVLFPLLPAGIMFRANQYITYGGPFGQYQMYGLGPYLQSLGTYWTFFTAVLVLLAVLLRVPSELIAFIGAWLSPPHARGVRRFVEVANAVLYYVGFPAFMAARFFL
ncbi:hypothetical protein F0U61_30195 [Archangium violaceum]|uniref:hypothetical protein n=1 Tax=Archangium violaceum TaxID=83451 RepID=UPI002B2BE6E4|nr:hypothetical protein F0U61_30195 [Archangium violaceum]